MESELPIFRPNIIQFTNFSRFISDLEQQNISFAKASIIYIFFYYFGLLSQKLKISYFQIIPPQQWSAQSKLIDKEYVLSTVVSQKASKLLGGAFNLTTEHSSMTYGAFEKLSKENEIELFGANAPSIDEMESLYWSKIADEKLYAISNSISLFGDCESWNLNSFTKAESNIHSTQPHYLLDVSTIFISYMWIKIFLD